MGRLVLLLLLALGAGLYIPESRAVIVEKARPALDPWHRWTTNQQLAQIVADLETLDGAQGRLPVARGAFEEWLERRYRAEHSRVDGWGRPYRLEVRGTRFRVISAGPDGLYGTDDDLVGEGTRSGGRGRR